MPVELVRTIEDDDDVPVLDESDEEVCACLTLLPSSPPQLLWFARCSHRKPR
jgi:hypothetical protein